MARKPRTAPDPAPVPDRQVIGGFAIFAGPTEAPDEMQARMDAAVADHNAAVNRALRARLDAKR